MPRDVEMQHTPAVVADDEETVENPKCKGWDREEVHRCDGFSMATQEGEPTFGSLGIFRRPAHLAGDSSLGDLKTQHQQLARDTRRAPGGILPHHPKDEIPHLLRNPSSADHPEGCGDGTPVKRKPRPVPTHDRLWTHNNESLFPSGPESPRKNPEELIERCQSRPWMPSFQRRELLTKGQVFKKEPMTSAEEPKKCAHQESDGTYHAKVLSHFACGRQRRMLLKADADCILARGNGHHADRSLPIFFDHGGRLHFLMCTKSENTEPPLQGNGAQHGKGLVLMGELLVVPPGGTAEACA